ncbi:MAG: RluA family pseudouridine synthase [Bdellovibrionota bacterium]
MQKITLRYSLKTTTRLDQAIAQSSEAETHKLSRSLIRKLIVAGAVYVNGKRVRVASRQVHGGETIDLYWNKEKSPENLSEKNFPPLRVLYEDDAIICFDKPAGLPTQPTLDEARLNLFQMAKHQLANQLKKPSIYLGLHHRLDRDTSGVLLFTRATEHNAFIADQFKLHKCVKVYVAMVHGRLKNPKGRLESFLAQVGKSGKSAKFGSVRSGGKKAITDFLVLGQNESYSLVEVRIATGRTHQIRVHFSEMGHPIVGDSLYGSSPAEYKRWGRFLLHAHALTIEHPVTHNLVRIESPIPPEFRL